MLHGSRGVIVPYGGGCTFGVRSATTGSLAVRSIRGRWPSFRRWCYRLGLRWPVGGPRKTVARSALGPVSVASTDLRGLLSVPSNRGVAVDGCPGVVPGVGGESVGNLSDPS